MYDEAGSTYYTVKEERKECEAPSFLLVTWAIGWVFWAKNCMVGATA